MMIHTHIFETKQGVAKGFAHFLAHEIAQTDRFNLALSGGSTPKILFAHLAEAYADEIDWSKVHLYWGDERCVPPTDPESNFGMTQEKLIQHINIPAANVHRVLGELDPAEAAKQYSEKIAANLPFDEGLPIFDLVLLGMGSDGHTASIFPHQMELMQSDNICEVATHPESGQKRVTLSGKVINAAIQIHFLVTGESKRPILETIFSREAPFLDYPAAHIENAEWWMDEAAEF